MAAPNAVFNQALSAATYKYLTDGSFEDNIFKANKLLGTYKAMNGYESVDGGVRLVVPLIYGTNPTVTSSGPWDTIPIQETDEFTSADYPWAQWQGALALSAMDLVQNDGESRVINLMDAKRRNLEMSIQQDLNGALFTGNSAKATNCLGLDQLVEATGTIGNIDSSVQTWWRSYVNNTSTSLTESLLEQAFLNAYQNISLPTIGVTTLTLYQKYMDLTRAKLALNTVPDSRLAELGFEQAQFKGKPIIFDVDCSSGDWYWLNFDFIKLYYHDGSNFRVSDQKEMGNQWVFSYKMLWIGQHCVRNRRLLSRLRAKTP